MYEIRDREAGNLIDGCETLEEALNTIASYEESDLKDGTFSRGFYEIVENEITITESELGDLSKIFYSGIREYFEKKGKVPMDCKMKIVLNDVLWYINL